MRHKRTFLANIGNFCVFKLGSGDHKENAAPNMLPPLAAVFNDGKPSLNVRALQFGFFSASDRSAKLGGVTRPSHFPAHI